MTDDTGWISVEDRLPADGKRVLVAFDTGPRETDWDFAIMHRHPGKFWLGNAGRVDDRRAWNPITHWRPLPEGPG